MVTLYARSSSSIKARYLDPQTSFILWTRSSVRQANRIQLEFSKASMNAKRALRQLFWRSTDLTFLQIIIVANRPTLPFSWGGGRRVVTGWTPPNQRSNSRETMDLHQALQTSDKSTTTASYAFNHIPKTLQFHIVLSSWTFSCWASHLNSVNSSWLSFTYRAQRNARQFQVDWLLQSFVYQLYHLSTRFDEISIVGKLEYFLLIFVYTLTFEIATFDDRHAIRCYSTN